MAHARRFGSRAIGSSSRRKTAWSAGPSETTAELTAAGAFIWTLGSQALVDGLTQVRVRGEYNVFLPVVTTIGDGYLSMAVGLCIVSENAFGVGITAVPTPFTDMGWDGWLFHRLHSQIIGLSTTELGVAPTEAFRIELDSKAMRKIRATDVLIGVGELGTEVGAATLAFSAQTRVLDKLP